MSYNAMLRSNNEIRNHEGAKAWMQTPEFELYSTVVCTMSLDDKFYESGSDRVNRIASLVRMVPAEYVVQLAIYARTEMHLRSVPMLLLVELSQCHSGDSLVSRATAKTIQRVDDITELLSCYQWRHRASDLKHMSNQLRKGIAQAFNKFDEYQFAKYNGGNKKVTLCDALFIAHPKAKDVAQQQLFNKIANNELKTPYTWETQISEAGKEKGLTPEQQKEKKRETWKELIESRRMGYMAMLRNLRNMLSASVDRDTMQIVYDYLSNEQAVKNSKQLPFRFFSAYLMMTGHVVKTSWKPEPTPYDAIISSIRSKYDSLYSRWYSLSYRRRTFRQRKVCKKRLNVRASEWIYKMYEKGLLDGLLHPWHSSDYRTKFIPCTNRSNHLNKYLSHLNRLRKIVVKQMNRYEKMADKYRETHPKVSHVCMPHPFYAPQETTDCLERAVMHSASSIPSFTADTRVCIACDTSGSMMSPVGESNVIQCYDLALFFGAMMKYRCKKAVVGMFGDRWMPMDMPSDNIMENVLKMRELEGVVGYSTNGHRVIEWLRKTHKRMDKVMIFTDCQLWDSEYGDASLSNAWHEYKCTVAPEAKLYLFDLAGYGQNPIDVDNEKDVYCIAGWSDKVFDMLAALENGKSVIGEIRRITV